MKQYYLLSILIFVAGCANTKTSESSDSTTVRFSIVHMEDTNSAYAQYFRNKPKYDSSDYMISVLDTMSVGLAQVRLKMYVMQASRQQLFTACNRHATADYRHWAIAPYSLSNIVTKGDSLIEGRYYDSLSLDYFLQYRLVDTVGGTNLYLTVRNNDKNFAWDYGVTWATKAISIAKDIFLIYKQFGRIEFGDQ